MTEIPILVALVIGLTEALKRVGLPAKFLPIAAVLLGIAFAFLAKAGDTPIMNLLTGLMIGLGSCGLFDLAVKPLFPKKDETAKE